MQGQKVKHVGEAKILVFNLRRIFFNLFTVAGSRLIMNIIQLRKSGTRAGRFDQQVTVAPLGF